ncbi:MAG: hypothetical protein K6T83_05550 [Alicyclobacillus sp.]|nr:hypothetical protein [Alicyclobacillus sp.]
MTPGLLHLFWTIVWVVALLIIVVCIPIQHRALNKIAFGRSMFISWTAILMGLIVSLFPSISATVVALVLFIIGFGFMILMAVKSAQHLRRTRPGRASSAAQKSQM